MHPVSQVQIILRRCRQPHVRVTSVSVLAALSDGDLDGLLAGIPLGHRRMIERAATKTKMVAQMRGNIPGADVLSNMQKSGQDAVMSLLQLPSKTVCESFDVLPLSLIDSDVYVHVCAAQCRRGHV
jgi:hypothetical protein